MKLSAFFFLSVFGVVSFSACKDDAPSTPTDFLTNGVWNIVELWEDHGNDGDPYEEEDNEIDGCVGDDSFTFSKNGTLTIDHGITICSFDEPSAETAAWWLSDDAKLLAFLQAGNADTINVISLTNNRMELHEIEDGRIEMVVVLEK
ncbi:MAG: lipocalin family protein [Lewinellaceae bacterium]|nr:lipocalin family protein [Saprospiraceae bacterium]MCB9339733.1 lipocalin family protein [Lewinellaceae bacterium]